MSYFIDLKSPADYEKLRDVLAPGMRISLYYRVGVDTEKHYNDEQFKELHICENSSGCGVNGRCYYKTLRFTNKWGNLHGLCVTRDLNRIEVIDGSQINKITEV